MAADFGVDAGGHRASTKHPVDVGLAKRASAERNSGSFFSASMPAAETRKLRLKRCFDEYNGVALTVTKALTAKTRAAPPANNPQHSMKSYIASQKRRQFLTAVIAAGAAVSGCGSNSEGSAEPPPGSPPFASPPTIPVPACTAVSYHPIAVNVIDATTGQAIADASGAATHTDGTTYTLSPVPESLGGARGRLVGGNEYMGKPGYWTVTVRATGYRDWTLDGVGTPYTTVDNPCPRTHELTARLVRST